MRNAEKTFMSVLAILITVMAFFAMFAYPDGFSAQADSSETSSKPLSYSYIMGAPVSTASSDEGIYILDEDGCVSLVSSSGDLSQIDSSGINYVGNISQSEAKRLAVWNDQIFLYGSDYAAVTTGSAGIYEVTSDSIYLRTSIDERAAVSLYGIDGDMVTAAADGDILYLISAIGERYSLYSIKAGIITTLVYDLSADGTINSAAVANGTIYYSTNYSLYSAFNSDGYVTKGGIISMTSFDGKLIFAVKSGGIYSFDGTDTLRITGSSEKISVATRHDKAAISDYGNNIVTVFTDGETRTYPIEKPSAVAIDIQGDVYAATDNRIVNIETGETLLSASGPIIDFDFTRENFSDPIVYAATTGGKLISSKTSGIPSLSNIIALTNFTESSMLALTNDGNVCLINGSELKIMSIVEPEAYDIDVDRAGNIYLLCEDAVHAYRASDGSYENYETLSGTAGIASFEISEVEFDTDGYCVDFGDFIAVKSVSGVLSIISDPGTEMLDDRADYIAFESPFIGTTPNPSSYAVNIAVVSVDTEIYPCPVEMPSEYGTIKEGTFVTLIEKYGDTNYWYAIAESESKGGAIGYIHSDTVNICKYMTADEMTEVYGSDLRRYVRDVTPVYKYPSTSAPKVINKTTIDVDGEYNEFFLAPFVSDYTDGRGNGWYRVIWSRTDDTGEITSYDGYIPAYALSDRSGSQTQPDYNGEIRTSENSYAECYTLNNGVYTLNGRIIANGTRIEIIGNYTKAETYTHIRYVDEYGAVRECYVLTSQVRLTEAGWYQVIMFAVAAFVTIFLVVLILIFIKRKKRIEQ